MNGVCPGLVNTNIAHSLAKKSLMVKFGAAIYLAILGKSADYGARFYITAARTSEENHVSGSKGSVPSTNGSPLT